MDIQTSKIELAKMILEIEDYATLNKVLTFLRSETSLSEIQKHLLDKALEQIELGQAKPHDVVMAETRQRYPQYFDK